MTTTPFFSESLLVTAPDGTYSGIRSRQRVSAFEDRIEIGGTSIHYAYLDDLRVFGDVLHVVYVASDGRKVEQFFRHDTFLAKTGARALQEMADRVAAARGAISKVARWRSSSSAAPSEGLRAEMLEQAPNGWQRVGVYSALVAFPAICPVCEKAADAVGQLPAVAGIRGNGWLIPVCMDHRSDFTSHFVAQNWLANGSRLEFTVWNRKYAMELVAVNEGSNPDHVRRQAESSPLLYEIRNGKRFIVYQYAVSVVVMSFLRASEIQVLARDESALVRGLKYSALSLIAGWWGIPGGPIFTITSVVRNCRGGIDLTPTVAAIVSGAAVSGGGY